jgi:multiple sugar transport system substrate-binding protein
VQDFQDDRVSSLLWSVKKWSSRLIQLRGMTWRHRRAVDPLLGTLDAFRRENPGFDVEWRSRPLSGFEFDSVAKLAQNYDLIILDHPFMGDAQAKGYLVNLADLLMRRDNDYIGPSLASYRYGDAIFAVPVDAACQVAVFRPDLMTLLDATPPRNWTEVFALGKRAVRRNLRLATSFAGVHSLMTFFTLTASLGCPCAPSPAGPFCDRSAAREALDLMRSLSAFCPPDIFSWNSIALHEAMGIRDDLVYCPAVYCYATYAEHDQRQPLRFAALPGAAEVSARGSTIGGTGLAISRSCRALDGALAYVRFAAKTSTQLAFASHHGQPARVEAWDNIEIDERFGGAFSATRSTLESSWIRPRYHGYLAFQQEAGDLIEQHLRGTISETVLIEKLENAFATSGKPT